MELIIPKCRPRPEVLRNPIWRTTKRKGPPRTCSSTHLDDWSYELMRKSEVAGHGSHKPRLWVITEVYYPEMISTGYYLTSIAEGLAGERTVKVITGQPKHMSRGEKAPSREIVNGVEIFRAAATTFDKNVFALRLVNMLT